MLPGPMSADAAELIGSLTWDDTIDLGGELVAAVDPPVWFDHDFGPLRFDLSRSARVAELEARVQAYERWLEARGRPA